MGYLLAVLSAFAYGISDILIHVGSKKGSSTAGQILIINLLAGNGMLVIIGIFYHLNIGFPLPNWPGVLIFISTGLLAPFLGRILNMAAIKLIGANRTGTLRVTDVFFTMLLAIIILGESDPFNAFLGAVSLITGITLLINETNRNVNIDRGRSGETTHEPGIHQTKGRLLSIFANGTILALTSAFCFAIAGVLRKAALLYLPSPLMGTIIATFFALLSNATYLIYSGQIKRTKWHVNKMETLYFSLGGFTNTIGMLAFFLALSFGGNVTMVATLRNTTPVFTLMLSWFFVRKLEHFSWKLVLSIFLVILGAFVLTFIK